MNEQLSDIADWLERYEATTFLQLPQKTNMLPVAILQSKSYYYGTLQCSQISEQMRLPLYLTV